MNEIHNRNLKKYGQRILATLGGLVLLLSTVVLYVTFIFDANVYRKPLAAWLSNTAGLNIELQTLRLSLFPRLGLKADGLRARSDSRRLFSADSLIIEIEPASLLQKQFEVKRSILYKPIIHVRLDRPNEKPPPQLAEEKPTAPRNATGNRPPPPLPDDTVIKTFLDRSNLALKELRIEQGQIVVYPKTSGPASSANPLVVNVSSQLQIHREEQGNYVVQGSAKTTLENLTAQIALKAEDALSPQGLVQVDIKSDEFSLSDLNSLHGLFPDALDEVVERYKLSGQVESVSMRVNAPAVHLQSWASLRQNAVTRFEFQINDASVTSESFAIPIPKVFGEGVLQKGALSAKVQASVMDGSVLLETDLKPGRKPSGHQPLTAESNIQWSDVNLAKLELLRSRYWIGGRISGTVQLSGLLADEFRGKGSLEAHNLKLTNPENIYQARRATLRFADGSRYEGTVDFDINEIEINKIPLRKMTGRLRISGENVRLIRGLVFPERGEIRLAGDYEIDKNFLAADFSGANLRAEDFAKDQLSGRVQFAGRVRGRLKEGGFERGTTGGATVKFTHGSVLKLEFLSVLLRLLNLSVQGDKDEKGLSYRYLGGDFKLDNAVLSTNNLRMDGKQLKLAAAGKADLFTGKLSGEIKAIPSLLGGSIFEKIPLLGELITGGKGGGIIETRFTVGGTLDRPKIAFNAIKTLSATPENLLKGILPSRRPGK
ncbi:MAG: AsmA-like C-terminal domain-containing protein [Nitrospinales bacterium]